MLVKHLPKELHDYDNNWFSLCFHSNRSALALQKKAVKELKAMFDSTSYFDSEMITAFLMVCPSKLVTFISIHIQQESFLTAKQTLEFLSSLY